MCAWVNSDTQHKVKQNEPRSMIYRHFSIAGLNKIIIAIDIELDEDKESSSIEFLGIYQLPFFEVFSIFRISPTKLLDVSLFV